MNYYDNTIQLITGAMRSGKTRLLTMVIQHNSGTYIDCEPNQHIEEIVDKVLHAEGIVCIDEFQFLIGDIETQILRLYNDINSRSRRIYLGMLQYDWKKSVFSNYTILKSLQDRKKIVCNEVTMITTCEICGDPAYNNIRIFGGDDLYVKNKNYYVTCCHECGDVLMDKYHQDHIHWKQSDSYRVAHLVDKYLLDKE